MKQQYFKGAALVALATASTFIFAPPAAAQNSSALSEIIVTARKRQESILNVPVVETAVTQQQLERMQTQDLKDLSKLVPGLTLGSSVLSIGTQVSLRGVGSSAFDPGVDASVGLNLDGLSLSQGLAYSSGMFDVGQVEVLKGPQSLFYGKASPGGVISLRTADPTDKFELIARIGYELEAQERRGELIISGPVTDTLRLRLAGAASKAAGFYKNIAVALPQFGARDPAKRRVEPHEGYMIRLTALWNPSDTLSARLKLNTTRDKTLYPGTKQLTYCQDGLGPYNGIPFLNPNDGCKRDEYVSLVDMDPAAFPGVPNNGVPFVDTTQTYGTLELDYDLTPALTLTSQTGYYLLHNRASYQAAQTSAAGTLLAAINGFHRRQNTQEFRLNSDYAGPFNFTLGAFIERGKFDQSFTSIGNARLSAPPILQKGKKEVWVKTESLFGQLRYKIVPQVEIAGGVRWTNERRNQVATNLATGAPTIINMPVPKIQAKNAAPELTITYRPTEDLTIFGALKRGYKSGSFNVSNSAPPTGENNAFGDEKVEGGEVGLKSRLFERRMFLNISAYSYKYSGLQVGANSPTINGAVSTRTVNAGSSKVYGVEADVTYQPAAIDGLNLRASVNYNHGRYTELVNVPCYGGQLISEGCNLVPGPTGAFTSQDRSGAPLFRAPDWQATVGFDWEWKIDDYTLILANNNQYSSRYITNIGYLYYQPSFIKADASLTLRAPGDRWEVALVGKNLNNALTSGNCSNSNNQGGLLGGQATGTNNRGPAGIDEIGCFMDRGREIWLRLTLRPFG